MLKSNGKKQSTPIFDKAGDPRLLSSSDKEIMLKYFNDSKPLKWSFSCALEQTIKHLQSIEKRKQEGKCDVGGVDMLHQMLQNGEIKLSTYSEILPIIQDYNKPFELIYENRK